MLTASLCILSALAGGLAVAWRLRAGRTLTETARAVIQGGGGPGPRRSQ